MRTLTKIAATLGVVGAIALGSAAFRFGVWYAVVPLNDRLNDARSLMGVPPKFVP